MTFLITRGYTGDQSDVILRGYGEQVVVVVNPEVIQGSGLGNYHKKRVKGIEVRSENTLLMLKPFELTYYPITEIQKFLRLDASDEILVKKMLKKMEDNPSKIDMTVFKSINNKLVAKQNFMHKLDGSLSIQGEKFLSFVEKQITIIDKKMDKKENKTKHINPVNTINDIEVTELLDIIKDMEDADV